MTVCTDYLKPEALRDLLDVKMFSTEQASLSKTSHVKSPRPHLKLTESWKIILAGF